MVLYSISRSRHLARLAKRFDVSSLFFGIAQLKQWSLKKNVFLYCLKVIVVKWSLCGENLISETCGGAMWLVGTARGRVLSWHICSLINQIARIICSQRARLAHIVCWFFSTLWGEERTWMQSDCNCCVDSCIVDLWWQKWWLTLRQRVRREILSCQG